jgi:hypothetical protein
MFEKGNGCGQWQGQGFRMPSILAPFGHVDLDGGFLATAIRFINNIHFIFIVLFFINFTPIAGQGEGRRGNVDYFFLKKGSGASGVRSGRAHPSSVLAAPGGQ